VKVCVCPDGEAVVWWSSFTPTEDALVESFPRDNRSGNPTMGKSVSKERVFSDSP